MSDGGTPLGPEFTKRYVKITGGLQLPHVFTVLVPTTVFIPVSVSRIRVSSFWLFF